MINNQIDIDKTLPVSELKFERLDRCYIRAQIVGTSVLYLLMMALALLLLLTGCLWLFLAVECVILVVAIINLSILPKAFRFKGYAFRSHDISYRSGIVFPKVTTIPYSRIQQVNVSQSLVSRYFHLYSVGIVNGAQSLSTMSIPGLTEETAGRIRDLVTGKLRECHD